MTIENKAEEKPKYVCPEGHNVPFEKWNLVCLFRQFCKQRINCRIDYFFSDCFSFSFLFYFYSFNRKIRQSKVIPNRTVSFVIILFFIVFIHKFISNINYCSYYCNVIKLENDFLRNSYKRFFIKNKTFKKRRTGFYFCKFCMDNRPFNCWIYSISLWQ